jgi:hypothetical protein
MFQAAAVFTIHPTTIGSASSGLSSSSFSCSEAATLADQPAAFGSCAALPVSRPDARRERAVASRISHSPTRPPTAGPELGALAQRFFHERRPYYVIEPGLADWQPTHRADRELELAAVYRSDGALFRDDCESVDGSGGRGGLFAAVEARWRRAEWTRSTAASRRAVMKRGTGMDDCGWRMSSLRQGRERCG